MHFVTRNANGAGFLYETFSENLKFVCVVILLFTSCTSNTYEVPATTPYLDSARKRADSIAESESPEKGFHFYDSVFKAYRNPNIADKYEYYYFFHDRYNRIAEHEKSELYIDSMFLLIETGGSIDAMGSQYAKANIAKADRLFERGNYTEAYEYYYRAKVTAESSTDSCTIGYYNYKIALALYKAEKYRDAITNFQVALALLDRCKVNFPYFYRMQEIMDDIGLCYYHLGKPDSAVVYYSNALDHIKSGRQDFSSFSNHVFESANAVIYGNMATAYAALKQYSHAEELFRKSIDINAQPGYDAIDAQFSRIKLAQLYIETGRTAEAKSILDVTRQIQDTLPNVDVLMRWHNQMWRYWEHVQNRSLAFNHLSQYNKIGDSLSSARKQLLRLDIDERVENLDKANQIFQLKKKDQLRTTYLLIAGIVAFLLFTIVLLVIQNWRKSRKNIVMLTRLNERMQEQKKKLETALHRLERSDKEKDRILKAVSHDMRSPVNSAVALTDLLLASDAELTAEQVEYVTLIKNSCTNALNLTKDLLEIATINSEKIKRERTNVNNLLTETTELLKFRADKKKQELNVVLPDEQLYADLDKEKMVRVINNLVSNAIKFTAVNGKINIRAEQKDNGVEISVQDNGIGIPDTIKDKIFDIFTEAKRFGTSGEEPYGLGLSITRQIVEMHQGKIWFESVYGKGTTFYIYLSKE